MSEEPGGSVAGVPSEEGERALASPGSLTRRQVLAGLGAAAAVGGVGSLAVAEVADAAARSGTIGVARAGESASRFVGRIDQNGDRFLAYGFFTLIAGLDQAELFSGRADPIAEGSAHFTFHATASLLQRSVIDQRVFVIDVAGTFEHHYQASPSASFNDPASFARGLRVARSSFTLQDILSTIAPNEGIPTIEGPITQLVAHPFVHRGRRLRLGQANLRSQLLATGRGTRTSPSPPVVRLSIAGVQIVTG